MYSVSFFLTRLVYLDGIINITNECIKLPRFFTLQLKISFAFTAIANQLFI